MPLPLAVLQDLADPTAESGVIVGTIWIAVGNSDKIETMMIEEDNGRDKNLTSATKAAMHMLLEYLKANCEDCAAE